MERLNRYTSIEAEFLKTKKEQFVFLKLLIKPPLRFADLYLLKQGFRDGVQGLVFSILSGFYDFVKYNKLFAMYTKRS